MRSNPLKRRSRSSSALSQRPITRDISVPATSPAASSISCVTTRSSSGWRATAAAPGSMPSASAAASAITASAHRPVSSRPARRCVSTDTRQIISPKKPSVSVCTPSPSAMATRLTAGTATRPVASTALPSAAPRDSQPAPTKSSAISAQSVTSSARIADDSDSGSSAYISMPASATPAPVPKNSLPIRRSSWTRADEP